MAHDFCEHGAPLASACPKCVAESSVPFNAARLAGAMTTCGTTPSARALAVGDRVRWRANPTIRGTIAVVSGADDVTVEWDDGAESSPFGPANLERLPDEPRGLSSPIAIEMALAREPMPPALSPAARIALVQEWLSPSDGTEPIIDAATARALLDASDEPRKCAHEKRTYLHTDNEDVLAALEAGLHKLRADNGIPPFKPRALPYFLTSPGGYEKSGTTHARLMAAFPTWKLAPPPRDVYAEIRATDEKLKRADLMLPCGHRFGMTSELPQTSDDTTCGTCGAVCTNLAVNDLNEPKPSCKRCGGPTIHYDPRQCPGPRAEVRPEEKPARLVEAKGAMRCLGER